MIRYLTSYDIYYSLNDVTNWLVQQQLLTHKQSQAFRFACRAYMTKMLAQAYEDQLVLNHLEPIILPSQDYFIHWIVWANLLMLLPEETGRQPNVHRLNLLLDDPETALLQADIKPGIKLVCLDGKFNLANC